MGLEPRYELPADAVAALGLGIGLNATVFTFVNAVLIRGLPFHHPEQILHVNGRNTSTGSQSGISGNSVMSARVAPSGR